MNDKYEFTGETKTEFGVTLHQIRAKITIGLIAAGTIGGWIEKEINLSPHGNAWVSGDAHVTGNARVAGDAWVSDDAHVTGNAHVTGDARVAGNAHVTGNAWVSDNAHVTGNARVAGDAWVSGDARVAGNAHVITISPIGSAGGCLTAFVEADGGIRCNRGCFIGTIDEFAAAVEKTHGDSRHGVEYRAAIALIRLRLAP